MLQQTGAWPEEQQLIFCPVVDRGSCFVIIRAKPPAVSTLCVNFDLKSISRENNLSHHAVCSTVLSECLQRNLHSVLHSRNRVQLEPQVSCERSTRFAHASTRSLRKVKYPRVVPPCTMSDVEVAERCMRYDTE